MSSPYLTTFTQDEWEPVRGQRLSVRGQKVNASHLQRPVCERSCGSEGPGRSVSLDRMGLASA